MTDKPHKNKKRIFTIAVLGTVLVSAALLYAARPNVIDRIQLEKNSDARLQQLALFVQIYAERNGSFPDSLEDALISRESRPEAIEELLTNPLNNQKPGYIYRKPPIDDIDLTSWTPIVFEAQDGNVVPDGAIGFINGRVRRP